MPSEIVIKCSNAIAAKGWNIAFAESATAGRMASEFSLTEKSGVVLRGGIVCNGTFVKEQLLNVPRSIIDKCTAESAEVSRILAQQTLKIFNSKIAVGITGLTIPSSCASDDIPIGTIFFHIITPTAKISRSEVFKGTSEEIVVQAVDKTARLVFDTISSM